MARALKVKIAIGCLAIFILVLIPLLDTKFFAQVTIKRWGQLSWHDFKGIVPPFTSYGAGISSKVYLEYDSSRRKYFAYAGQNNIRSWVKDTAQQNDYGLNHEQYHFNITELHARMLNDYIERNPKGTFELFALRHASLNIDLARMQDQYDSETDHCLVYDQQRRWEYRVDSLLLREAGWHTDYFSGAKAYFPDVPDSINGFSNSSVYRSFSLVKYGMQFSMFSYHLGDFKINDLNASVNSFENQNGRTVISVNVDSTIYDFEAFAVSSDSIGYNHYTKWVYSSPYLYKLYSWYPNMKGDTAGYIENALSFINSFQIVNTDKYWVDKFEASDSPIIASKLVKMERKEENEKSQYCMYSGTSKPLGFYRGPFYREDGGMLLAYDYLIHADSLRYQDVMSLNQDWYSYKPTSEAQIYFVPAIRIPKEILDIKVGYILLQDTTKECYEFYHDRVDTPPND